MRPKVTHTGRLEGYVDYRVKNTDIYTKSMTSWVHYLEYWAPIGHLRSARFRDLHETRFLDEYYRVNSYKGLRPKLNINKFL